MPVPKNTVVVGEADRPTRRGASLTLVGLVALVAVALVIRAVSPAPYVKGVSEKSDFFFSHLDDFDVLFLGSSAIYRHISPAVFDEVTAEAGLATRSFNFGLGSMRAWEALYLLERIQRAGPRLNWVVMDANAPSHPTPARNVKHPRFIDWHTPRVTWIRSRALVTDRLDAGKTVELHRHLVAFFLNFGNLGRLSPLVFGEDRIGSSVLGPDGDGWNPLRSTEPHPLRRGRREKFLANLDVYNDAVSALAERQELGMNVSTGASSVVRQLRDTVRSMGAQPVFVSAPHVNPLFHLHELRSLGEIDLHLEFTDPNRFPDLYRAADRFDSGHLTEEASLRFTRLLAEEFVEAVGGQQPVSEPVP